MDGLAKKTDGIEKDTAIEGLHGHLLQQSQSSGVEADAYLFFLSEMQRFIWKMNLLIFAHGVLIICVIVLGIIYWSKQC